MPARHLTTSGRLLHTQHGPELHTYLSGAQHADGSLISLSHFYPSVTVIIADLSGMTQCDYRVFCVTLIWLIFRIHYDYRFSVR